jgi:hypothetical protein
VGEVGGVVVFAVSVPAACKVAHAAFAPARVEPSALQIAREAIAAHDLTDGV